MSIASEISRLQQAKADIKDAIEDKGVTVPASAKLDTYDDYIAQISSGGGGGGNTPAPMKDVNFFDYDGTIVYSYSASEFASLTALPNNPSHTGLTAQGWNWSLSDAKAHVAAYKKLSIGQMYITSDGKTRIYVHLEEGRLNPGLCVCPNGTVVVDWGDGSATETLTGTSITTQKWTSEHNYSAAGDYVITLTVTGAMGFIGMSDGTYLFGNSSLTNGASGYRGSIRKIELGTGITSIANNSFYDCYGLLSITLPNVITSIGSYAFCSCYNLAHLTIPSSVTSIGSYMADNCMSILSISIPRNITSISSHAFSSCRCWSSLVIPDSITSIGTYAFQYCYSLIYVLVPASVTSIGSYAFQYCNGAGEFHFLATVPPTLGAANVFSNLPTDCKIYVPAASLSDYQAAQYWSNYASRMVGE